MTSQLLSGPLLVAPIYHSSWKKKGINKCRGGDKILHDNIHTSVQQRAAKF